jgi:hypothetical protein
MPNLNPNFSDTIVINGNTFISGATLPGTPTLGGVTYNLTGLSSGTTYYFAVIAFSDFGYSGWAGPIPVYTLSAPIEFRQPLTAFAWSWPHSPIIFNAEPSSTSSTSDSNLFPQSNYLYTIWGDAGGTPTNLGKNTNIGPGSPPQDVIPYSLSGTTPNQYVGIRVTQRGLCAGETYTYSFYHQVSAGVTSLSYRILTSTNAPGILMKQISPVEDSFSADGGGEKPLNYGTGLTGWQRFGVQFVPGSTQTDLNIYLLSKTFGTPGQSTYFGGFQLSKGSTLYDFVSTGIIANWEGNCAALGYTYDDNAWLNESNNRGWTYISPMVSFTNAFAYNPFYTTGWTYSDDVKRAAKLLKALPENRRSILPVYFFTPIPWRNTAEGISYSSGNTYTFYDDLYSKTNTNKLFPNIWAVNGLTQGKQSFESIASFLSATGATVDYLFSNTETFADYFSFSGNIGATFRQIFSGLTQYNSSYYGLTSFASWMQSEGATIAKVGNFGPNGDDPGVQIYQGKDYIVWDGIVRAYTLKALEEIYSPINQYYPNATKLEYDWSFVSDGGPLDGAPDQNGHEQWFQYLFGDASAPQIYSWMAGIANGNMGICGANPTYLYFKPASSDQSGITLNRGPWTSFVMALQTIRSAKRGLPNTPIIPWIGSVRFVNEIDPSQYPPSGVSAPAVGFADINVGYNPWQGVTITSEPGNSAYYYEMIRHVSLLGTKSFAYWNAQSFANNAVPKITNNVYTDTALAGDTGYVRDHTDLNNVLGEINEKLGGFTLSTADASRISWLAPYVASGAPGPNGITWWWRITTNPGNTTFVNGQTLSVFNNNIVGIWVSTTGPTLAGISITSI